MTACVWQLRDGRGFYFCIFLTQKLERLELFSNYTLCNAECGHARPLGLKSSFVMGMGYFGGFMAVLIFFSETFRVEIFKIRTLKMVKKWAYKIRCNFSCCRQFYAGVAAALGQCPCC